VNAIGLLLNVKRILDVKPIGRRCADETANGIESFRLDRPNLGDRQRFHRSVPYYGSVAQPKLQDPQSITAIC
jgi:hypothetical protein